MPHVAVLGSLHLDYLVRLPYIPRKGETLRGDDLDVQPGGKGANQAYNAALQGATTYMIGRVGDDSMGELQVSALRQAGVDTHLVRIDPSAKSGMSIAMIDNDSDYGAVILPGANQLVTEEDVNDAADTIQNAACLVMQYEIPLPTVLHAARLARKAGVPVVLNAAPAYPSPEIVAATDIIIVNEIEAEMLLGLPNNGAEKTLAGLADIPAPAVKIVTLGAGGLVFQSPEASGFIPSHQVAVQDAHGAGDCFVGALSARLAMGDAVPDAIRYGNAAAAVSVTRPGPRAGVTPDDVRGLLQI